MPFPVMVPLLHDQVQDQPQAIQEPDEEQKAAEKTVNCLSTILLFTGGICYSINKLYASTAAVEGYRDGTDDAFNRSEAKYPPNSIFTFIGQYGLAILTTFGLPALQRYINLCAFRGSKVIAGFCTFGNLALQYGVINTLFDSTTEAINYSAAFYNFLSTTAKAPTGNPMSHVLIEEPRIEVMDAVCATVTAVSFIVAVGAGLTFFHNRRARLQAPLQDVVVAPVASPPRLSRSENNE
jgi:hypothetical protein